MDRNLKGAVINEMMNKRSKLQAREKLLIRRSLWGLTRAVKSYVRPVSFSTGKWPGRDLLLDEDSPVNFEVEQREEIS